MKSDLEFTFPKPRSAAGAGWAFQLQFGGQWPGAADSGRYAALCAPWHVTREGRERPIRAIDPLEPASLLPKCRSETQAKLSL